MNARSRCFITYLQRILSREGFVATIAWVWFHSPVYPFVPLQIVVPRERRRALIALVGFLWRPLLRLEHHATKMAAVPAHARLRIVRYERHGPARVRQVMHVLRRLGRCLLVARVVREAAWAPGSRRRRRRRLMCGVLSVVVLMLLRGTRGATER